MNKLDLSLEQLEVEIASAYERHLLLNGRLTDEQLRAHDYSFAIPEIYEGNEPPSPLERARKFTRFALDQLTHAVEVNREELRGKVCVDAAYCKNKGSESFAVLVATIDGALSTLLSFPIPAATITAWLIKTKWLDKLCQCPQ